MAMDISNCNFCYPKLRASPSYGEAIRYHAEFRDGQAAISDVVHYSDNFQRYISEGVIEARIDWGPADSSQFKLLSNFIMEACFSNSRDKASKQTEDPVVEFTVHRIGRRPAMTLLAYSTSVIKCGKVCSFPEMISSWSNLDTSSKECVCVSECLLTLKIFDVGKQTTILQRTLHVAPPPIGPFKFRLKDLVWAPKLFKNDNVHAADLIHTVFNEFFRDDKTDDTVKIPRRRRGFGLELETVQMPLNAFDFEADCFTQQQQFEAAINRARNWHISNVVINDDEDYFSTVESINSMWDRLLLWSVSHDLYVENSAPPSRLDLYERIRSHIADAEKSTLAGSENADVLRELDHLVLGGKVPMPPELLVSTPYDVVPTSQASPEYKSPLPPNELYHEFPPPPDGKDQADASIRLFLDGILRNPLVSTKPVVVPLVSDLGQSATSIHVHVNVANPIAWPRTAVHQSTDLERTQSLLCVIFGWICFDRVIQTCFCMPNVWRDRSFAPMLPTGPEFVWRDLAWDQGLSISSVDDDGTVNDVNVYNLPAWFRHVHSSYLSFFCQEEKKEFRSLFETVFDHATMSNTLSRWNSLNLLPINSYGTIEFRRMHASLNADFVSAWTWFCVGFVERFSSPMMWKKFLFPFLEAGSNWKLGLERLADAQNNATIEDLVELMFNKHDPALPNTVLHILLRNHDTSK
ncbi:hypothetical protein ACHAWX_006267 [Stephanocyclus meneghinianus]